MRRANTIDVLNKLLVLHHRSLPMYLGDAVPWTPTGSERSVRARRVLDNIVADHKDLARRIGEAVMDRGGQVELGGFPMEFTDLHMLSLDFLLHELIKYSRRDLATISDLAAQLDGDLEAQALALEAKGNARGHLDTLEELPAEPAPSN